MHAGTNRTVAPMQTLVLFNVGGVLNCLEFSFLPILSQLEPRVLEEVWSLPTSIFFCHTHPLLSRNVIYSQRRLLSFV